MLSDVGVLYEWLEVDNDDNETLLVSYQELNGTVSNINNPAGITFNQTDRTIAFAPQGTTTYRLRRSVISDGGITGFSFCETEDDVKITVTNGVDQPEFSLEQCGNSVSLAPVMMEGSHSWDFGDGTPTTSDLFPIHEYTQPGTYTITHTVTIGNCTGIYTESVTVPGVDDLPDDAGFSVLIDPDCFNNSRTVTLEAEDEFWEHTFTLSDGQELTGLQVSTDLPYGIYTIVHTVSNDCGSLTEQQTIEIVPCLDNSCTDCDPTNTLGLAGQSLKLSSFIAQGSYSDETYCIEGTLSIDEGESYTFNNCVFRMKEGASLLVNKAGTLVSTASTFHGCTTMWRGIEVNPFGTLILKEDNFITDAQYAIYAHPSPPNPNASQTTVSIQGNSFVNNFVGVFIAKGDEINSFIAQNEFRTYLSSSTLKPPFNGQTSGPEGLPNQNQFPLAGCYANRMTSVFSSYMNSFDNLTSGIVLNNVSAVISETNFTDMVSNVFEYPSYTSRGHAVRSNGDGAQRLSLLNNTMTNCITGSNGFQVSLTAFGNNMSNVSNGIRNVLFSPGNMIIGGTETGEANSFVDVKNGILVAAIDPNIDLVIENNTINTNTTEQGHGIRMDYSIAASATISENTVTVEQAGFGIMLQTSWKAQILDNTIDLTSPTQAFAGISLSGSANCAIRDNTITGDGTTGPNNMALRLVSSSNNTYCCNIFDKTRYGTYVVGTSTSTDNFRGNTFKVHQDGLFIDQIYSILGTQTHTENCWEDDVNGNAVYAGVTDAEAQVYPFFVDPATPNQCFLPNAVTPSGWFFPSGNNNSSAICTEENCSTTGLIKPDSPDAITIAEGAIDTGIYAEATNWELSRYLYRGLQGVTITHPSVDSFMIASSNNNIGSFQELDNALDNLYKADGTTIANLKNAMLDLSATLSAIQSIDSQLIDASQTAWPGLMDNRIALLDTARNEVVSLNGSRSTLITQRTQNTVPLQTQNDTISTSPIFEQNAKEANTVFLQYLQKGMTNLDSVQKTTLENIANQCPFSGGNAVFKARALLAAESGNLEVYDDNVNCNSQALAQPPSFDQASQATGLNIRVFPNPARESVTVQWPKALENEGLLELYDTFGKKLKTVPLKEGTYNHSLQLHGLTTGIYLLRVKLKDQETTVKLTINP